MVGAGIGVFSAVAYFVVIRAPITTAELSGGLGALPATS
jgi:hypothetical protein